MRAQSFSRESHSHSFAKDSMAKHILAMLFFVLLFMSITLPSYAVTIKVGLTNNPPKINIDEEGKISSIYKDIMDYIAKEEGWQIEYELNSWVDNYEKLKRGELDLLADMVRTPEREEAFSFHNEDVMHTWAMVYARKGNKIRTYTDLADLSFAVLPYSSLEDELRSILLSFGIEASLIYGKDYADVMRMVQEGIADATVLSNLVGNLYAPSYKLQPTRVAFEPHALFFAGRKDIDGAILRAIDKHLIKLKGTPQSFYYNAMRTWFHPSEEVANHRAMMKWILFLGLSLLVVFIAAILYASQSWTRKKEIAEMKTHLESQIEERTEALSLSLHKTQVEAMVKSSFLATMSHELKTPLSSIIGFSDILVKGYPGELNSEQERMVEIIGNLSKHLLALINDVMDISKIDAGLLPLKLERFELKPFLNDVLMSTMPQAIAKNLRLSLDIQNSPTTIKADKRRLEQVLLNIIGNAIKYTDKGEVVLSSRQEAEILLISVKDTGMGICKEIQEQIFGQYKRLSDPNDPKCDGAGLGLYISKKFVNTMGGDISFVSTEGQGSTFTVSLPLNGENTPSLKAKAVPL